MNYEKLGFKAGIEIHQQLAGRKLFSNAPALVNDENEPDIFFERKLRAVAGETGKVDKAAAYEMKKDRIFRYEACSSSSTLVEFDEEPPAPVNEDALEAVIEVALLLNANVVNEVHFMRKTIVDGSNVSGFQRTALIAVDGYVETSKGRVGIDSICLEEESAKKIEEKPHVVTYRLDRLGVALVEIATDASIKDPEHAKEVSSILGMMLRSTGKVRRGIGSIRQDVNVSIKGHPRVELKGFQDLRSMPKTIDHEVQRQQKEKKGESHVRKANADGTSTFMRPMPGAARMYPETDVPVVVITRERINAIKLPELIDEKVLRYEKEYNLSADAARMLIKHEIDFTPYTKFKRLESKFIAEVLISYPKQIQKRYKLDVSKLKDKDFQEVLGYLNDKKIPKGAVLEILVEIVKGKKIDLSKYKQVDTKILEEELKKIVAANKGASIGALMGEAMKKFHGKVDGKMIMMLLKKMI
jgi:Glu-tRNA(Gln) amidotransferase subunit E-like FAD-binding protein